MLKNIDYSFLIRPPFYIPLRPSFGGITLNLARYWLHPDSGYAYQQAECEKPGGTVREIYLSRNLLIGDSRILT